MANVFYRQDKLDVAFSLYLQVYMKTGLFQFRLACPERVCNDAANSLFELPAFFEQAT